MYDDGDTYGTAQTPRDQLRALGDPGKADALLDSFEQQIRGEIADELRRAPLPALPEYDRTDHVARMIRSIDTRLAASGRQSDYWVPAQTDDPGRPRLWETAAASAAWLDQANGTGDHETAMRLMKLGEEAGEVMAAYIGMTGQNPRKGVTHRRSDVAAELCDVIITAATALHAFTADPAATLDDHARRISRRIG
ncbi:MazG-like family protein [Streptomyces sp. NPDC053079]|uniref:MazG-like family protein n=1 Tax=Streptomyces sp. NPDC053079 TaxID=3365697 RepID=UPI0037D167F7